MIAILDVNAAIEILLQREKKNLFESAYESAEWVIAPDLYVAEICNVFWKYYKAKAITHAECVQYAEVGIDMIDDFADAGDLWKEALGEAIKNNHSVYDMLYAVLARRNDAVLMTNDKTLSQVCKRLRIEVVI